MKLDSKAVEAVLRPFLIEVFRDPMIGFYFRNSDFELLLQKEVALALEHLTGEGDAQINLIKAHTPHRINGGHFNRRMVLLKKHLSASGLGPEIEARWLDANVRLRPMIVGGECS